MKTSRAEICRQAGVSKDTLYVWLRDPDAIKPSLRTRIEEAIARLGVPASALRSIKEEPERLQRGKRRAEARRDPD